MKNKKISIVGLGGVGSHTAITLMNNGFKNLTLVDFDTIDPSNLNRQIMTNIENIGKYKAQALKDLSSEILNDSSNIVAINKRFQKTEAQFLKDSDFIVDAIDTVTNKLELIEFAQENNIPIISALGTGNKFDPLNLKYSSIYSTQTCPLARVIRRESKKRNLNDFPVVYSTENASKKNIASNGRHAPSSMIFVPGICGFMLANYVINFFGQKYER